MSHFAGTTTGHENAMSMDDSSARIVESGSHPPNQAFPFVAWALGPLQTSIFRIADSATSHGIDIKIGDDTLVIFTLLFLASAILSLVWMIRRLRTGLTTMLFWCVATYWIAEAGRFLGLPSSSINWVSLLAALALSIWPLAWCVATARRVWRKLRAAGS